MAVNIITGFHWCNPVNAAGNPSPNSTAKGLLQRSGRWGATLLLSSSCGGVNADFQDACDKIMDAREANGGGRSLDQCIVRIYSSAQLTIQQIPSVARADNWLRQGCFYNSLDYFVAHGGRMAVIFNELNLVEEPQHDIDPRVMGYLAYALASDYWNGGDRLLTVLFPGPSGLQGYDGFASYWNQYDFLTGAHSPRTFGQVYGIDLDPLLADKTMLWHNGSGVFDRVALHCYEDDVDRFRSPNPTTNKALQYLAWLRDYVDDSGWVYVTEANGHPRCSNPLCDCGNTSGNGSVLADFEQNANDLFRNQPPYFLQGIYGYVLQKSDCGANSDGWTAIDTAYIDGYNTRRQQLGF